MTGLSIPLRPRVQTYLAVGLDNAGIILAFHTIFPLLGLDANALQIQFNSLAIVVVFRTISRRLEIAAINYRFRHY